MREKHFNSNDWATREGSYWNTFFNTISGPRTVVMIGTEDEKGIGNIGLFNSMVHLGANPPLLGFILRPDTVPRHTYKNILQSGTYTINHSTPKLLEKTHQTSAKYTADQDEFAEIGFNKEHIAGFHAPFIEQSPIKIGLSFVEEHKIEANQTRLIVGKVEHVIIAEQLIEEDGYIDCSSISTLLTSGLNAYHSHQLIKRVSYARP
ncbi:MAG: flavin reductase [Salibacteraceae bacterium]